MAKSPNQKLKLLYLLKILTEQSDENHCMSAQALIDALSAYDIPALTDKMTSRRSARVSMMILHS